MEPTDEERGGGVRGVGGVSLCRIPPLNTMVLLWMTDAA